MTCHLTDIRVQQLGPIRELHIKPRRLNVIYGHNEQGKTHLVEFLIQSLFKKTKIWQLRGTAGHGRVLLNYQNETLQFSPSSQTKLEDLWKSGGKGLPLAVSKLLVVKGAEVELAQSPEGVNKSVVKHFLSNQAVLDQIEKNISSTIRAAEMNHGMITGHQRGEIKARDELMASLQKMDQLFSQVDQDYSGGKRAGLAREAAALKEQIEMQQLAKAFYAGQLDAQIQKIEHQKQQIDREALQGAKASVQALRQKEDALAANQKRMRQAEENSRHFPWLKSMLEFAEQRLEKKPVQSHPWFYAGAGFAAAVAAAAYWLHYLWISGLALTAAFALLLIQDVLRRKQLAAKPVNDEWQQLCEDYQIRFNAPMGNTAELKARADEMETQYRKVEILKEQTDNEALAVQQFRQTLTARFNELSGESGMPESEWTAWISGSEAQWQALDREERRLNVELARLDVDESDYIHIKPETVYQAQALHKLTQQLAGCQRQIDAEDQKLNQFKATLAAVTNDDLSSDWDVIIAHLRNQREELKAAFQQKTAEIVGKKTVFEILESLRQDEDAKIAEGLKGGWISKPLQQLTQTYSNISLNEAGLALSDGLHAFDFSQLSTGAREQALLALRIGFASKLFQDTLFIILDDAFQYSDWTRRQGLVQKMAELAESGWQIFYFTMDDHIRDLFVEEGRRLKEQFLLYTLNER